MRILTATVHKDQINRTPSHPDLPTLPGLLKVFLVHEIQTFDKESYDALELVSQSDKGILLCHVEHDFWVLVPWSNIALIQSIFSE